MAELGTLQVGAVEGWHTGTGKGNLLLNHAAICCGSFAAICTASGTSRK
jgi:hypothetical protein